MSPSRGAPVRREGKATVNDRRNLIPFNRKWQIDPAWVAEFGATARRLQREREQSVDVVMSALRDTPRHRWTELSTRDDFRTNGVLERLGQEVDRRLDSDPREALAIAELATEIADTLEPDAYQPVLLVQTRAAAWKDRGQALCYLSRYDEALAAIDHAEQLLAAHGTLAHDRAIVRFVRATMLQHMRKFDEAQSLLDECSEVFYDHSDFRRHAKCQIATANLRIRRGDYWEARKVLTPLAGSDDASLLPLVQMGLGWCAIHLQEPDEALVHFVHAAHGYQMLGRGFENLRARYGAATARLRLGDVDEAIAELQPVRATFLMRGMIEEAGLSGLEIVEVHMLRGDLDEARELAASIVREFSAAQLNRRAVAALAYLNDAIAANSATAETVRTIHSYIEVLQTDPTRELECIN